MSKPYEDDLEDLALELGGSVEYETGAVFNSSGKPVARKAAREKQSEQDSATNKVLMQIAEALARQPQPVMVPPASVVVNPSRVVFQAAPERAPVAWRFDFVRNNDGTIASITATPTGVKP